MSVLHEGKELEPSQMSMLLDELREGESAPISLQVVGGWSARSYI